MKFYKEALRFSTVFLVVVIVASCEEEFSDLGNDIVGDPNFDFEQMEATVKTYSERTEEVQTNNLPDYQIGVYNDPTYGLTQSSWLTQLELENTNPDFGDNPEIDSVVVYVPYYSEVMDDEESSYKLDSIFGNGPFKLSIYESNYFLRQFDPESGFEESQKYYSNQSATFESNLSTLLYEEEAFVPSNEPIILNPGDEDDEETLAPGMRIKLPVSFFTEKILQQEGTDVLLSNSNFKNYFRGLYFKAEATGADGSLILFDIEDAEIEIFYTHDSTDPDAEEGQRDSTSETITLSGVQVNVFDTEFSPAIAQDIANQQEGEGSENVYLKGNSGAVTVVELFGDDTDGDGVADALSDLRDKKYLINEASLEFHVNQDMVVGGNKEPERIMVYDLDNNRLLIDYSLDNLTPENDPLNYKANHMGRLKRDSDGNGTTYKIRLTSHVSDLINRDSTNVRLGLAVTQNVSVQNFLDFKNEGERTPVTKVPVGSIISPEGTILHGSESPDSEKRVKFNIYYTEID